MTAPASPEALLAQLASVARSGEMPDEAVTKSLRAVAAQTAEFDGEELYDALTPPLCDKHAHVAMQWMRDVGLLELLLPELDATVAFSQEGGRRHKDVWEHTKTVVRQAVPRPEVRWAAALHDIGKVPTRKFTERGRVTFHGHAEVGVRMFRRGPAKRITFPKAVRSRVEELIRYHLRPGQYERSWTDSAVRRFDKEMGDCLRDLLDLSRADITSKRPGKRQACLRQISALAKRIEELRELDAKPKPLPPGLGNHLMSALELPPGKHLALLRGRLEALFEAGEIEGGREAEYYVNLVRERDLLAGIEIQTPRGFKHQARASVDAG
jgi:poly(A) polymerase